MSRFKNSKPSSPIPTRPMGASIGVAFRPSLPAAHSSAAPAQSSRAAALETPDAQSNMMQAACFVVLCLYLLSSYANEFAFRLFSGKAYISTVTVVLLPLCWIGSGAALQGLRLSLGKWFLAFGFWLGLCVPLSVWRGNAANEVFNYYFRAFLLYFVICACVITLRRLRTLMYAQALGAFFVVVSCVLFGFIKDGRFAVFGSVFSFLSNSNELAMQLLLGIVILVFPFFRKPMLPKILSALLIAASIAYMLKTGSRANVLAVIATLLSWFVLSRKKARFLMVAVPVSMLAIAVIPQSARDRLMSIAIGDSFAARSPDDASAIESQQQRTRLFWNSVRMSLEHPILGVGPGDFMAADSGEKKEKGEYEDWRGTHNTYTQVSSEAGFPGLIFYVACLVLCLRLNRRVYRESIGREGLEDYAGLSFCMLLSTVAYAVSTFFDHVAYTSYLPIIAGITAATYMVSRPVLGTQIPLARQ